jgi:rhamnose utilization protein RhaD (predicted bifunctional aldolase and dehydrogenase)
MSPTMLARQFEAHKEIPKLLLVPPFGILALKNISRVEKEMIQCLVDVVRRVSGAQKIRYLTQLEEKELLNWDAEKYRMFLNTDPASNV